MLLGDGYMQQFTWCLTKSQASAWFAVSHPLPIPLPPLLDVAHPSIVCAPSNPRYAEPEWQIEQDVLDGKLYGSMWGLKKNKRPHGEQGRDGQGADSLLARRAAEARARVERAGSMMQGGRSVIRSEGEAVL